VSVFIWNRDEPNKMKRIDYIQNYSAQQLFIKKYQSCQYYHSLSMFSYINNIGNFEINIQFLDPSV